MAWTAPGTAVAGGILTAAFWNTQVRDNLLVLKTSITDAGLLTPSSAVPATATDLTIIYRESIPLFWCQVLSDGSNLTLGANYNVASLSDDGVGKFSITFDVNLPTAQYGVWSTMPYNTTVPITPYLLVPTTTITTACACEIIDPHAQALADPPSGKDSWIMAFGESA